MSSDASLKRIMKHLVTNRKCVCIVSIVKLCRNVYYLYVVHVILIYYVKPDAESTFAAFTTSRSNLLQYIIIFISY